MLTLIIAGIGVLVYLIVKQLIESSKTKKSINSIDLTETLTTPSTDIHVEIAKTVETIKAQDLILVFPIPTEPVAKPKKKDVAPKAAAPKMKANSKKKNA